MANAALIAMQEAEKLGWFFTVTYDDYTDYGGTSAEEAWKVVEACSDELTVNFYSDPTKRRRGYMLTCAYGLEPNETIIDHSTGDADFELLMDNAIAAAEA